MNEVGARYTAQMRAQRGKAWRHGITKPIEYGEQTKLLYKGGSTKPPKRRPGEETEDYNRRVRDSISRVEATAGNLKPGVDKKQARAAYQLIADLEDRKREGKRMYRLRSNITVSSSVIVGVHFVVSTAITNLSG